MEVVKFRGFAQRQLELGEYLRKTGVWPLAISLMGFYANRHIRNKVARYGDATDHIIVAGAARIAHVASNSLARRLDSGPQQVIYRGIVVPINDWFSKESVSNVLSRNSRTVHGGIDWYMEHLQDRLSSAISFADNTADQNIVNEALAVVDEQFGNDPLTVTRENAAKASAAGVLYGRIARVVAKINPELSDIYMSRGVRLVLSARGEGVGDSDRVSTVMQWAQELRDPNLSTKGTTKDAFVRGYFNVLPLAQILAWSYN